MNALMRRRGMMQKSSGRLPRGFKEKTCIFSTEYFTYIDTGVIPTNTLVTTIDFRLTSDLDTETSSILGAYNDRNYSAFLMCTNSSITSFIFQSSNRYEEYTNKDNSRHLVVWDFKNKSITVDANRKGIAVAINVPKISIYLFAANRANGQIFRRNTKGELYYLKFEDGGETVAEFIPCVRNLDGKAGLFDLVSGTFRSSIGTHEFSAR